MTDCCDHERHARNWRALYRAAAIQRDELERLLLADMPVEITHTHIGPRCHRCGFHGKGGVDPATMLCWACIGATK